MPEKEIYIPFLRWAGGKRWLSHSLSPYLSYRLSQTKGTYFEPFLGAGAMYFGLAPQISFLSDLNKELIETYVTVKDHWEAVESHMKKWKVDREVYYYVRSMKPDNSIETAARFIWLNRVCYGGLYRVNGKNEFNVPYGGGARSPEILYQNNILSRAASALSYSEDSGKIVNIVVSDFERMINRSVEGDVVYCDPTYSNVSRGQFDRYGSIIFDWKDQIRLAEAAAKAFDRGAIVIISNGFFSDLNQLYSKSYRITVSKRKTIGNKPEDTNRHKEYLFILDPWRKKKLWGEFASSVNSYIKSIV